MHVSQQRVLGFASDKSVPFKSPETVPSAHAWQPLPPTPPAGHEPNQLSLPPSTLSSLFLFRRMFVCLVSVSEGILTGVLLLIIKFWKLCLCKMLTSRKERSSADLCSQFFTKILQGVVVLHKKQLWLAIIRSLHSWFFWQNGEFRKSSSRKFDNENENHPRKKNFGLFKNDHASPRIWISHTFPCGQLGKTMVVVVLTPPPPPPPAACFHCTKTSEISCYDCARED